MGVAALAAALAFAGSLRADGLDAALDLCRRTRDYVAKSVPAERLAEPNAALAALEGSAAATSGVERAVLETKVRALRRRILFLHPDLAFDRILAVQRGVPYSTYMHQNDQYLGRFSNAGPGLVVIDDWKGTPKKREILKGRLPTGTVLNPDLHWDADRVIFAFCDHTRPALDGSFVRQLTGTPDDPMTTQGGRDTAVIEDYDPCYLPDGGFVFTSTRCQNFGRCHWGRYVPCYTLYRGELPPVAAGSAQGATGIRPLTFGEANEWEPSVLDDGRLVYTRWDYIDRIGAPRHHRRVARADRSGQGRGRRPAARTADARDAPPRGGGLRPAAPVLRPAAAQRHAFPLRVLDRAADLAGQSRTREPGQRAREGMSGSWPSKAAYGIWLVDRLGGRELIYRESLGTVPVAAVAAQPIDALVNRGDPKLSRVLTLLGESSPYYATLRACCEKAIRPHPCADKAGTCGRDEKCVCRSCWVRKGGYNHPKKQDR